MTFNKKVTLTKRNNVYFGSTESKKMAVSLEEAYVDLNNIFDEFNNQQNTINAIASGYIGPSGSLYTMASYISEIEKKFEKRTYIQATQDPIF